MKKRVFILGQCTLHWGRMEFGNIGNYYILEPLFSELRRVFPDVELVTTMQLSDDFCNRFDVETVPMELYYDFKSDDNLEKAKNEYQIACEKSGGSTPFIDEVKKADLVIDFSGDIWGDNADFLGRDRFATGCYKDLVAQKFAPTVMIAGSPGPFGKEKNITLARETYSGFNYVSNREPISTRLLEDNGFDISNTHDYPCPSFLFQKSDDEKIKKVIPLIKKEDEELTIGFIMCGWNFKKGPFDAWPREDSEYENFAKLIRDLIDEKNAHIVLLSHSNGFDIPPAPFVLKHGRDYPIMQQLYSILEREGYSSKITLLDGVYSPAETKAVISHFDVLISGRMHGAVAGLSQNIPTVIIDYGHEPKAHKLRGFAEIVGDKDIIADPNDLNDLKIKTENIIENRLTVKKYLMERNQVIFANIHTQFDDLRQYLK